MLEWYKQNHLVKKWKVNFKYSTAYSHHLSNIYIHSLNYLADRILDDNTWIIRGFSFYVDIHTTQHSTHSTEQSHYWMPLSFQIAYRYIRITRAVRWMKSKIWASTLSHRETIDTNTRIQLVNRVHIYTFSVVLDNTCYHFGTNHIEPNHNSNSNSNNHNNDDVDDIKKGYADTKTSCRSCTRTKTH